MKQQIILLVTLLITGISTTFGQSVSIGTNTSDPSSILELNSETQGFLPPRMTTAQRGEIESPAEGLTIYNTTTNCIEFYNATDWVSTCENPIVERCGAKDVTFTYNGSSVTYGIVYNETTGRCWLDRNLGAIRVAQSTTDHLAYGDLFQWGRGADGHQRINWTSATSGTSVNGTINTLYTGTATTGTPGHDKFITNTNAIKDWRNSQNSSLWQGVSGPNNPCPDGFRVPNLTEWFDELFSSTPDWKSSVLKLTMTAGNRSPNGSVEPAEYPKYWTSDTHLQSGFLYTQAIWIQDNGHVESLGTGQVSGYSVRCIKD